MRRKKLIENELKLWLAGVRRGPPRNAGGGK